MNMLSEFGHHYENEKSKVFKTLWSCRNEPQLKVAENFFIVLKNKWKNVIDNNQTIKILVDIDELKFYKDMQLLLREMQSNHNYLFV